MNFFCQLLNFSSKSSVHNNVLGRERTGHSEALHEVLQKLYSQTFELCWD